VFGREERVRGALTSLEVNEYKVLTLTRRVRSFTVTEGHPIAQFCCNPHILMYFHLTVA
jgi:hypothetical protein